MRRFSTVMAFTAIVSFAAVALPSSGEAKKSRHHHQHYASRMVSGDIAVLPHPSGCPRTAFCGCGVSVKVFGRPVRDLYLASNWRKFPSASPGPGMVTWRPGHVMYIEAMDANGNATVYDPNSGGHRTHRYTRSLAGFRIVNPNGGNFSTTKIATAPPINY